MAVNKKSRVPGNDVSGCVDNENAAHPYRDAEKGNDWMGRQLLDASCSWLCLVHARVSWSRRDYQVGSLAGCAHPFLLSGLSREGARECGSALPSPPLSSPVLSGCQLVLFSHDSIAASPDPRLPTLHQAALPPRLKADGTWHGNGHTTTHMLSEPSLVSTLSAYLPPSSHCKPHLVLCPQRPATGTNGPLTSSASHSALGRLSQGQ